MTSEQRTFARRLRSHPTKAESVLWQALRGRRFDDLKFRRQVPLSLYTVDFLCLERKLIVELDGKQHGFDREYDEQRSRELEGMGFLLIRFSNEEIVGDIDEVLAKIKAAAMQ